MTVGELQEFLAGHREDHEVRFVLNTNWQQLTQAAEPHYDAPGVIVGVPLQVESTSTNSGMEEYRDKVPTTWAGVELIFDFAAEESDYTEEE